MHKLVKLGIVSMSALVLVACGESDTVDKDNLPVDLGTVPGYEDGTNHDDEEFKSSIVDSSVDSNTEEEYISDDSSIEESESLLEEEQAAWDADFTPVLNLGESATMNGVTFTVTDSKYIDASSNSEEDVVKVLQISFNVENNSDFTYSYGNDFDVYIDGFLAYTNDTNESYKGNLQSGSSFDGNLYFDIAGDGDPNTASFTWEPRAILTDDYDEWSWNWEILPE